MSINRKDVRLSCNTDDVTNHTQPLYVIKQAAMESQELEYEALVAILLDEKAIFWCNNRPFCLACWKNGKKTIMKRDRDGIGYVCPDCGSKSDN